MRSVTTAGGLLVVMTGLAVLIGWVLEIGVLKSILPYWVTMKITTALMFVLSGFNILLCEAALMRNDPLARTLLPMISGAVVLCTVTILASAVFGVRTGIEAMIVAEGEDPVMTTEPGRPSAGTLVAFTLLASAGFIVASLERHDRRLHGALTVIAVSTCSIGVTAIIGYAFDVAPLFYLVEGVSTAMAAHTAALFTASGIAVWALSIDTKTSSRRREEPSCP